MRFKEPPTEPKKPAGLEIIQMKEMTRNDVLVWARSLGEKFKVIADDVLAAYGICGDDLAEFGASKCAYLFLKYFQFEMMRSWRVATSKINSCGSCF